MHQHLRRHIEGEGGPLVVLLHGFAGVAEDLAPFGRSMGVAGTFVFPEAPIDLAPRGLRGKAWLAADGAGGSDAAGPRDLSDFEPEGLDEARARLDALLSELVAERPSAPLVLGGFSQGAMLAFDLALRTERPLAGVVQLSGCRIASRVWNPLLGSRRGTRAFVSHGRSDPDLSFGAAEAWQRDLAAAGWNVDFFPFDGGHETPLAVLRALKKFLRAT
jgi:phospholipase/carboxylesterase